MVPELRPWLGKGGMHNPSRCLHRAFRAFLPAARARLATAPHPPLPTHQKVPSV